ncbi:MAG: hypothetical protein K9N06_10185 [Candidatus Cloacimonetes bacterium]|nr:hypothetical protein [Candidatus Cloacimonadota bacterium]
MKIMLLLGSGISIPAGMPNCKDIGSVLRNGHTFGLYNDESKKFTSHNIERYNDFKFQLTRGITEKTVEIKVIRFIILLDCINI